MWEFTVDAVLPADVLVGGPVLPAVDVDLGVDEDVVGEDQALGAPERDACAHRDGVVVIWMNT